MVRFRCIRSNGNARKRHETGNGNTGYPSCFRNGLTCFCHVSVYGFLQFRPVMLARPLIVGQEFEVTVPGEANGGMGTRNLKTDGGLCTSKNSALFLFMYVL